MADFSILGEARLVNERAFIADVRRMAQTSNAALNASLGSIKVPSLGALQKGIISTRAEFNQLTEASNDFGDSLTRGLRRIVALSAASAALFGVAKAFQASLVAAKDLEKALKDINVILNLPSEQLQKFGQSLFDVARNTKQSLEEVSKAAVEFARQGLSVEETLKRTEAALILVNLAGVSATDATETLTAAMNSFSKEGLTAIDIVNRIVAVDAKFAVSAADLAESLRRVGSTAQDSGVDLNRLISITTAAQQVTQRGGAVIGNALKTIFQRLQRQDTLDALEELGVSVREVDQSTGRYTGNLVSADNVLRQLAARMKTLNQEQRAQVSEMVAGIYQGNIFRGILNGLTFEQDAYQTALGATDEAIRRNRALLETLDAKYKAAGATLQQVGANIGQIGFGNLGKRFLDAFNSNVIVKSLAGTADDTGNKFGEIFIKAFADTVVGVGLPLFVAVGMKITSTLSKFLGTTFKQIMPFGPDQAALGKQALAFMTDQNARIQAILASRDSEIVKEQRILSLFQLQNAELAKQSALAAQTYGLLTTKGAVFAAPVVRPAIPKGTPIVAKSGGHIPNLSDGLTDAFVREAGAIAGGHGGAPSSARPVFLKNFRSEYGVGAVANTSEYVVPNYANSGKSAIFNREMIRQVGIPNGATPVMSNGYISNYAFGNSSGKPISSGLKEAYSYMKDRYKTLFGKELNVVAVDPKDPRLYDEKLGGFSTAGYKNAGKTIYISNANRNPVTVVKDLAHEAYHSWQYAKNPDLVPDYKNLEEYLSSEVEGRARQAGGNVARKFAFRRTSMFGGYTPSFPGGFIPKALLPANIESTAQNLKIAEFVAQRTPGKMAIGPRNMLQMKVAMDLSKILNIPADDLLLNSALPQIFAHHVPHGARGYIPNYAVSVRPRTYSPGEKAIYSTVGRKTSSFLLNPEKPRTLKVDFVSSTPKDFLGMLKDFGTIVQTNKIKEIDAGMVINPKILQMVDSPSMRSRLKKMGVQKIFGAFNRKDMINHPALEDFVGKYKTQEDFMGYVNFATSLARGYVPNYAQPLEIMGNRLGTRGSRGRMTGMDAETRSLVAQIGGQGQLIRWMSSANIRTISGPLLEKTAQLISTTSPAEEEFVRSSRNPLVAARDLLTGRPLNRRPENIRAPLPAPSGAPALRVPGIQTFFGPQLPVEPHIRTGQAAAIIAAKQTYGGTGYGPEVARQVPGGFIPPSPTKNVFLPSGGLMVLRVPPKLPPPPNVRLPQAGAQTIASLQSQAQVAQQLGVRAPGVDILAKVSDTGKQLEKTVQTLAKFDSEVAGGSKVFRNIAKTVEHVNANLDQMPADRVSKIYSGLARAGEKEIKRLEAEKRTLGGLFRPQAEQYGIANEPEIQKMLAAPRGSEKDMRTLMSRFAKEADRAAFKQWQMEKVGAYESKYSGDKWYNRPLATPMKSFYESRLAERLALTERTRQGLGTAGFALTVGGPLAVQGIGAAAQPFLVKPGDRVTEARYGRAVGGVSQAAATMGVGLQLAAAAGPTPWAGVIAGITALASGALALKSVFDNLEDSSEDLDQRFGDIVNESGQRLQAVQSARVGTANLANLVESGAAPRQVLAAQRASLQAIRGIQSPEVQKLLRQQTLGLNFSQELQNKLDEALENFTRRERQTTILAPAAQRRLIGRAAAEVNTEAGYSEETLTGLREYAEAFTRTGVKERDIENAKRFSAVQEKLLETTESIGRVAEIGGPPKVKPGTTGIKRFLGETLAPLFGPDLDTLSQVMTGLKARAETLQKTLPPELLKTDAARDFLEALNAPVPDFKKIKKSSEVFADVLKATGKSYEGIAEEAKTANDTMVKMNSLMDTRLRILSNIKTLESGFLIQSSKREIRRTVGMAAQQQNIEMARTAGVSEVTLTRQQIQQEQQNIANDFVDAQKDAVERAVVSATDILKNVKTQTLLQGTKAFSTERGGDIDVLIEKFKNTKSIEDFAGYIKKLTDDMAGETNPEIKALSQQFIEIAAGANDTVTALTKEQVQRKALLSIQREGFEAQRRFTERKAALAPYTEVGGTVERVSQAKSLENLDKLIRSVDERGISKEEKANRAQQAYDELAKQIQSAQERGVMPSTETYNILRSLEATLRQSGAETEGKALEDVLGKLQTRGVLDLAKGLSAQTGRPRGAITPYGEYLAPTPGAEGFMTYPGAQADFALQERLKYQQGANRVVSARMAEPEMKALGEEILILRQRLEEINKSPMARQKYGGAALEEQLAEKEKIYRQKVYAPITEPEVVIPYQNMIRGVRNARIAQAGGQDNLLGIQGQVNTGRLYYGQSQFQQTPEGRVEFAAPQINDPRVYGEKAADAFGMATLRNLENMRKTLSGITFEGLVRGEGTITVTLDDESKELLGATDVRLNAMDVIIRNLQNSVTKMLTEKTGRATPPVQ